MVRMMTTALALACFAGASNAAITALHDRNTSVNVNDSGTLAGMTDFVVDGVDNLFLQGFWFRTAGMNNEANVGTLPLTGFSAIDTNPFVDARVDTLALQYSGAGFTIEPTWTVRGGAFGSNTGDVLETIVIRNTNTSGAPLAITFFQYSDFDLNGSVADDSVEILGPLFNTARQTDGQASLSETVVTPQPTRWQVDSFPNIVNMLNDGVVDNLSNNAGPIGPGDLTWAFQWDFVIPAGGSVSINKDKRVVVPTPGVMSLLALAPLTLCRRRR